MTALSRSLHKWIQGWGPTFGGILFLANPFKSHHCRLPISYLGSLNFYCYNPPGHTAASSPPAASGQSSHAGWGNGSLPEINLRECFQGAELCECECDGFIKESLSVQCSKFLKSLSCHGIAWLHWTPWEIRTSPPSQQWGRNISTYLLLHVYMYMAIQG